MATFCKTIQEWLNIHFKQPSSCYRNSSLQNFAHDLLFCMIEFSITQTPPPNIQSECDHTALPSVRPPFITNAHCVRLPRMMNFPTWNPSCTTDFSCFVYFFLMKHITEWHLLLCMTHSPIMATSLCLTASLYDRILLYNRLWYCKIFLTWRTSPRYNSLHFRIIFSPNAGVRETRVHYTEVRLRTRSLLWCNIF